MLLTALSFPNSNLVNHHNPIATELAARGIALRPAIQSDMVWLRDLYATTREQELKAAQWPPHVVAGFIESQFSLQHRHYVTHFADADFCVVEQDGKPIGRYYVSLSNPIRIIDICLHPSSQRNGIGSALIAHTLSIAASKNYSVFLHVLHTNVAAARLYDRLGFVPNAAAATASHREMCWQPPTTRA